MPNLFHRTDSKTIRKTLAIYWIEIKKDKKTFITYATLVPINRFLYIIALPLLISFILQSLISHPHDWQYPMILVGVGLLVSIASLITSHIGVKKLFLHEEALRTRLIRRAVEHLMHHSDQFFANRKVGSLAGDISSFGGSIVTILDIVFLQSSALIVNFVISLLIIGIMSPILLLPLGLATGLMVALSIKSVNSRGPLRQQRKTLMAKLNGTIADILGNQQIVRYFSARQREASRVANDREHIERIAEKEIIVIQNEMLTRQAMLFAFQLLTMTVCIWLYTNNMVSIAALIFAVTYLGRLTGSLFEITPIIRGTEQAFLDAADITEILDEEPEIVDSKNAKQLTVTKGKVVLDDVTFKYAESEKQGNAIDHISLTIEAGQRVGLAGHSGGGKTTLTKLLLRFADVTDGSITIDGQNIAKVTQDSLRSQIAYVPQEPYMFHRSLRDNIAYGKPDATDDEIMQAAKEANAYEFIKELPNGLDTIVGERGVKLSGGQRQRVAIARAILKDAPILVLDEATSALDSHSEKLIQDALEKLMKGRTSIVVAHRLSTIATLDRIIVLDHGQIIEDGTHRELIKKDGVYASLWSHQSGGFIEE